MIVRTLCKWMIRKSQQAIGLVPYRVVPDARGMVSGSVLLAQPWRYDVFRARDYDFAAKRTSGSHVIVARGDYRVIQYSSDPREGTTTRRFDSMTQAAAHCAKIQMTAAVSIAMAKDKRHVPSARRSFEELKAWSDSLDKYQAVLETRLARFLDEPATRRANWLIDLLA